MFFFDIGLSLAHDYKDKTKPWTSSFFKASLYRTVFIVSRWGRNSIKMTSLTDPKYSGHQFLFKIEVLHFSPDGELMCRQYYCVHIQYNDLIFGYNSSRSGQGTRNMEVFLSLWSSSISVSYVRSVHNTFATILVEERLIPFFNTMVNPFI